MQSKNCCRFHILRGLVYFYVPCASCSPATANHLRKNQADGQREADVLQKWYPQKWAGLEPF
jgi:hypothetical protein